MNETSFATIDKTTIDKEVHTIDHGSIVYSHSGYARVQINFEYWDLSGKDVLILFPGDMIKWEIVDEGFSAYAIRYSSNILRSASMNVEHAVYDLLKSDRRCGYTALINEVVDSMFRIFKFYFTVEHYSMTDRIVALQLQAFFLGFYDYLQSNPRKDLRSKGTQRTEELFNRFMELLEREHERGREVNYYAERMNITRRYLGIIVRGKTGMPPKRIIDEYIIQRLKLVMRTSKRSLKQISHDFHFTDQTALTRYFRTHVGISPQQYRLK